MILLENTHKSGENSGVWSAFAGHHVFDVKGIDAMADPTTQRTTQTSVYLYYDSVNILLYVGITGAGALRNRQHNGDKEWWQFVVRQSIQHFDSRALAHAREVELIQKFRPPFNVQHNPGYEVFRSAYLKAREEGYYDPAVFTGISLTAQTKVLPLEVAFVDSSQRYGQCWTKVEHGAIVARLRMTLPRPLLSNGEHGKKIGEVIGIQSFGSIARIEVEMWPGWRFTAARLRLKPIQQEGRTTDRLKIHAIYCEGAMRSDGAASLMLKSGEIRSECL